jgi:hypothetical protein
VCELVTKFDHIITSGFYSIKPEMKGAHEMAALPPAAPKSYQPHPESNATKTYQPQPESNALKAYQPHPEINAPKPYQPHPDSNAPKPYQPHADANTNVLTPSGRYGPREPSKAHAVDIPSLFLILNTYENKLYIQENFDKRDNL